MHPSYGLIVLTSALVLTAGAVPADKPKENKLPDQTRAILDKADQFELMSLDPKSDGKDRDGFHGWKILGKTAIKDAPLRKQIVESLYQGISDSDGIGAKCFWPRHGIRANADGVTVDVVICFECGWVYLYSNKNEGRSDKAVTTGKPQATFDKALTDAGVSLPKPTDK